MANLPPVGGLREEGGVIRKLQEFLCIGLGGHGHCVGDVFPQLHGLPVRQEVCNPPVSGFKHAQLGELPPRNRVGMIVFKAELKSTNRILA